MNCRECEEWIAGAARDGRTLEAAAEHLAGCGACREFARDAAGVAAALARWPAPEPLERALDAAIMALLDRVAPSRKGPGRLKAAHSPLRQPALLALPGVALAAVGLTLTPEWARVAAACWAAASTTLAAVVLLCHAQPAASEGDWS